MYPPSRKGYDPFGEKEKARPRSEGVFLITSLYKIECILCLFFGFGPISGSVQPLFLVLCAGIISGGSQGMIVGCWALNLVGCM